MRSGLRSVGASRPLSAVVGALLVLSLAVVAPGASAFGDLAEHDAYVGVRLGRYLDPVCYDTWDNGTNATCRTFEENAGDAANVDQNIDTAVFSPGKDHLGRASNASLRWSSDSGLTNGKSFWYLPSGDAATTVEFDLLIGNSSAGTRYFARFACRTGAVSCTGSDSVEWILNGSPSSTSQLLIRYDDTAGTSTQTVDGNGTDSDAGEWHHVVLHRSSEGGGELYLWSIDNQTWIYDTAVDPWSSASAGFMVEPTGGALTGNTTIWIDNLYFYSETRADVYGVLNGTFLTSLGDTFSLFLDLIPLILLVSLIGAATAATRRV